MGGSEGAMDWDKKDAWKDFPLLRKEMVERQLRRRNITDPRVLKAMGEVPRHLFVPRGDVGVAYDDGPLPIGFGQTISQPYIVALMTQSLALKGGERVLEVGTGSGYQAAILSGLCRTVHSVERLPSMAERARRLLADLRMDNVAVHVGDGTAGWPEEAPYDAIVVTAAPQRVPAPLLDQLAEGGRMVIPVGPSGWQVLELWRKEGGVAKGSYVTSVAFVPLVGKHGQERENT
jgi:protein-L-isoaspartate(D-aspartate) O-methyltransferase